VAEGAQNVFEVQMRNRGAVSVVCDDSFFSRGCFIFMAMDAGDKGCWVVRLNCCVQLEEICW
jgi:hypothetical protein